MRVLGARAYWALAKPSAVALRVWGSVSQNPAPRARSLGQVSTAAQYNRGKLILHHHSQYWSAHCAAITSNSVASAAVEELLGSFNSCQGSFNNSMSRSLVL